MAKVFKPLQAGELRHVGNLEQLIAGVDAAGGPMTRYELFAANIRFAIADYRVSEMNQAGQIVSQITTYIATRWRPGIEGAAPNTMRLAHCVDYRAAPPLWDYYDIQGLVRDRTTRFGVQFACVRRDAAGYRMGTIP